MPDTEMQAPPRPSTADNGGSMSSPAAETAKTTRCYKNCGIPDELLDGIFEPQQTAHAEGNLAWEHQSREPQLWEPQRWEHKTWEPQSWEHQPLERHGWENKPQGHHSWEEHPVQEAHRPWEQQLQQQQHVEDQPRRRQSRDLNPQGALCAACGHSPANQTLRRTGVHVCEGCILSVLCPLFDKHKDNTAKL